MTHLINSWIICLVGVGLCIKAGTIAHEDGEARFMHCLRLLWETYQSGSPAGVLNRSHFNPTPHFPS